MSDPIRDLENFSTGGTPMTPLPAAEVRRRGDRLRRRNTTLLSVAGAVAVAAIVAAPLALTGGNDKAGPDTGFATRSPSATSSTEDGGAWLASIPADFPLEESYPADNEDGAPVTVEQVDAPELFTLCDEYVSLGDDVLDGATVSFSAPEDDRNRWLAVYPDAASADRTLGGIRSRVMDCLTEEVKGTETVLTPFSPDLGERSFGWTSRYRTDGLFDVGLGVYHAVRVGNAVLLDTSYGEGGPTTESRQASLDAATDAVTPVVKAMNLFAEHPDAVTRTPDPYTSEPGTSQVQPGPATDNGIPADFPIDVDLSSSEGDALDGPSARAEGVPEATFCDVLVWPNGGDARLAVTAAAPEFYEGREVVRYASAAEAVTAMAALRQAVLDCPEQPQQDGSTYLTTEQPADTGYDTFAFSRAYEQGLGGEGYVFTRVGTAVLALYTSGELAPENMDELVARLVDQTARITPAMCTFTAAGC